MTAPTSATTYPGLTPASNTSAKAAAPATAPEKRETIAPAAMDAKLKAAHSKLTTYLEEQGGAVNDWKSVDRNLKSPGHTSYIAKKRALRISSFVQTWR